MRAWNLKTVRESAFAHPLRAAVRVAVTASCFVCLAATAVGNLGQFLQRKTSNTIAWQEEKDGYAFPFFVFCPDRPVEDFARFKIHPNMQEIRENARNISVDFMHLGVHELHDEVFPEEPPAVSNVYTAYNGVCKGFHIKGEFHYKTTAGFKLPAGKGGEQLFFLRDPGERILLAYQAYNSEKFESIQLGDGEILVSLSQTHYHTKRRREVQCWEDVGYPKFYDCLLRQLDDYLTSHGLPCKPPALTGLHPLFDKRPQCESTELIRNATGLVNDFLYFALPASTECPSPCRGYDLIYHKVPLVTDNPAPCHEADGSDRERSVMVRYSAAFAQHQDEFFVFDFLALVTSVGGAMGMFVGWSCMQAREPIEAVVRLVERKATGSEDQHEDES